MKIVIISLLSPRDIIVIQEILRNFEDVTLIHLYSIPKGKKISMDRWINSRAIKIRKKIQKIKLLKSFGKLKYEGLVYEKIPFPSKEINTERGIALIQGLSPVILFTSGAPILKEFIIRIPKLAAINTHFGCSPFYRGNDTLFWALYSKDYDHLGGCLHYIAKGVDTGNILVQVRPDLEPGDGELSLIIKVSTMLAKASVHVLNILQNCEVLPNGKIQVDKGRNFKASERSIFVDLRFLLLSTIGNIKVIPSQARIDYFL